MTPAHRRRASLDLHALTLAFRDEASERKYREHAVRQLGTQARVALIVGLVLYMFIGVLDPLLVPDASRASAWAWRVAAMSYAVAVLALTYHRLFVRFNQIPLALVGPVAAIGVLGVMWLMPAHAHVLYYPAIILVVFWTYLALGVRFVCGLAMNIAIVAAFYVALAVLREMTQTLLAVSAFFLVAGSIIAGGTSYVIEFRQRLLFLRREQLVHQRERHRTRALHDSLTGLPNRDLLSDRIDQAIAHAQREQIASAGLYMDLDGFKLLNDTQGHAAGDQALRIVAERLRTTVRPGDTVARMGGDEFFVLARGVSSADAAAALARRILAAVEEPIALASGASARIGVSIGICLFPYPGCTAEDLSRRADQAMYAVKREGKSGFAFHGAARVPQS